MSAPVRSVQKVQWLETEYPTIYANLMEVGLTPFDISITCGDVKSATPTEVVGNKRVKLITSPEGAANLIKILQAGLDQYVKMSGPLRTLPQGDAATNPQ